MTEKLTLKDRIALDFEMEDAMLSQYSTAEGAYRYLYITAIAHMGTKELLSMHNHVMSDHHARMSS